MDKIIRRAVCRPRSEIMEEAQRIKEIVAGHFEIPVKRMDSHGRQPHIVWPRQISMYLCSLCIAGAYQNDIAACFGSAVFSRPTVSCACRTVRNRIATEPDYKALIEKLKREVEAAK